jgi:hypothetical protein
LLVSVQQNQFIFFRGLQLTFGIVLLPLKNISKNNNNNNNKSKETQVTNRSQIMKLRLIAKSLINVSKVDFKIQNTNNALLFEMNNFQINTQQDVEKTDKQQQEQTIMFIPLSQTVHLSLEQINILFVDSEKQTKLMVLKTEAPTLQMNLLFVCNRRQGKQRNIKNIIQNEIMNLNFKSQYMQKAKKQKKKFNQHEAKKQK